ncbi:hypothetical protein LZ023_23045 [Pseudomonas silvicola]|nr:hypothetical protein LZ023_23045 [Pseudomonas silvicola]
MGKIFLSASVPSSDNSFYEQCDPMLIQAALRTFLYTVLGRKYLVFGGHPTISPLILAVCEDLGIDNRAAVTIYQSKFFATEAPKVNLRFGNLVEVVSTGDRQSSLELMRRAMFRHNQFEAAVFIGGQQGILDEHKQFRKDHSGANVIALRSPGGASASIDPVLTPDGKDYDELLDYVGLFTHGLGIGLNSERNLSLKPSKPRHDPGNTFGKG